MLEPIQAILQEKTDSWEKLSRLLEQLLTNPTLTPPSQGEEIPQDPTPGQLPSQQLSHYLKSYWPLSGTDQAQGEAEIQVKFFATLAAYEEAIQRDFLFFMERLIAIFSHPQKDSQVGLLKNLITSLVGPFSIPSVNEDNVDAIGVFLTQVSQTSFYASQGDSIRNVSTNIHDANSLDRLKAVMEKMVAAKPTSQAQHPNQNYLTDLYTLMGLEKFKRLWSESGNNSSHRMIFFSLVSFFQCRLNQFATLEKPDELKNDDELKRSISEGLEKGNEATIQYWDKYRMARDARLKLNELFCLQKAILYQDTLDTLNSPVSEEELLGQALRWLGTFRNAARHFWKKGQVAYSQNKTLEDRSLEKDHHLTLLLSKSLAALDPLSRNVQLYHQGLFQFFREITLHFTAVTVDFLIQSTEEEFREVLEEPAHEIRIRLKQAVSALSQHYPFYKACSSLKEKDLSSCLAALKEESTLDLRHLSTFIEILYYTTKGLTTQLIEAPDLQGDGEQPDYLDAVKEVERLRTLKDIPYERLMSVMSASLGRSFHLTPSHFPKDTFFSLEAQPQAQFEKLARTLGTNWIRDRDQTLKTLETSHQTRGTRFRKNYQYLIEIASVLAVIVCLALFVSFWIAAPVSGEVAMATYALQCLIPWILGAIAFLTFLVFSTRAHQRMISSRAQQAMEAELSHWDEHKIVVEAAGKGRSLSHSETIDQHERAQDIEVLGSHIAKTIITDLTIQWLEGGAIDSRTLQAIAHHLSSISQGTLGHGTSLSIASNMPLAITLLQELLSNSLHPSKKPKEAVALLEAILNSHFSHLNNLSNLRVPRWIKWIRNFLGIIPGAKKPFAQWIARTYQSGDARDQFAQVILVYAGLIHIAHQEKPDAYHTVLKAMTPDTLISLIDNLVHASSFLTHSRDLEVTSNSQGFFQFVEKRKGPKGEPTVVLRVNSLRYHKPHQKDWFTYDKEGLASPLSLKNQITPDIQVRQITEMSAILTQSFPFQNQLRELGPVNQDFNFVEAARFYGRKLLIDLLNPTFNLPEPLAKALIHYLVQVSKQDFRQLVVEQLSAIRTAHIKDVFINLKHWTFSLMELLEKYAPRSERAVEVFREFKDFCLITDDTENLTDPSFSYRDALMKKDFLKGLKLTLAQKVAPALYASQIENLLLRPNKYKKNEVGFIQQLQKAIEFLTAATDHAPTECLKTIRAVFQAFPAAKKGYFSRALHLAGAEVHVPKLIHLVLSEQRHSFRFFSQASFSVEQMKLVQQLLLTIQDQEKRQHCYESVLVNLGSRDQAQIRSQISRDLEIFSAQASLEEKASWPNISVEI